MNSRQGTQRFSRRTRMAVLLGTLPFLAILACPVAAYLVVRHELDQIEAESDGSLARAEADIRGRVQNYARAILAEEDPDLPDRRLDDLAAEQDLTVREISRTRGLRLVVRGTGQYGWWRSSPVHACYELDLADLATARARYELRLLVECPPSSRAPASPASSRSPTG